MSARVRTTVIASVLLSVTPGLALAGVCFDVTGLPEAASLNVVALAAPQGPIPLVGEAQGVCGLGQPALAVQGPRSSMRAEPSESGSSFWRPVRDTAGTSRCA